MQLTKFQEQVFFATVRITLPDSSGTGASIGTGFIYRVPIVPGKDVLLLISNRHVYGDANNPIHLVFHRQDDSDPNRPDLGKSVQLSGTQFDSIYTGHPDSDIDLACINISPIGHNDPPIFHKHISETLLPDFDHEDLLPGNEVWFVGYPANRFDTKHNLPVLRRGYIASIPKVDFEGREEFLIDAQVFPGSSGSPVFTAIGGKFRLVGVVTQTMIKNEKLQAIPTAVSYGVQQTIGLGIVLKASLIPPLIEAATGKIREELKANSDEPTLDQTGEQDAAEQPATAGESE